MSLAPDDLDSLLRLAAAAGCGMVLGFNRDLVGKPAGMRTLGLVALGAALVALTTIRFADLAAHPDATSRVVQGIIQGVLTGIGFVGAGVVLRDQRAMEVHGLTTAATVWVTAALGIACALGPWILVLSGLGIALALLAAIDPLERFVESRRSPPAAEEKPGPATQDPPADPQR